MRTSSREASGLVRLAVVIACAGLALAPAASMADGWSTKWKNGFRVESEDGDFKLKFGGRLMADWSFASPDREIEDAFGPVEDGSEFRRARIFFSGTVFSNVEFKAQFDFADGGDAEIKDMWVGFKNTPAGKIRIGHFKEPFSLEEITSSKYITFLERSLPNVFAPGRNTGIMLHDNTDRFTWAVGLFRETNDFGESSGDGKLNITGRITGLPMYENDGRNLIHLGLSYTRKDLGDDSFRFRQRPEAHISPRFVNTGNFDADSVSVADLEFAMVANNFWAAAEYFIADADAPTVGDPSFTSFYVQTGVFLTGEHRAYKKSAGAFDRTKPRKNFGDGDGVGAWELALRYSTIDLNDAGISGGEMDDLSLGVNWYPNSATRLMMDYVTSDVDQVGDANFFLVRMQIDF